MLSWLKRIASNQLRFPGKASPLVKAADQFRDKGDFARAAEKYAAALESYPDRHDLRVQLGNMLKDSGRFDDAEASYRQAIQAQPDNLDARIQLGRVYILRADDASAQAYFLDVVDNLGDLSSIGSQSLRDLTGELWHVADRLRDAGSFKAAEPIYRAISKIAPTEDAAILQHGNMLKDIGEFEKAIDA